MPLTSLFSRLLPVAFLAAVTCTVQARTLYLAPDGRPDAPGTLAAPFGSFRAAQAQIQAGDTLWIRGGRYRLTNDDITRSVRQYARVIELDRSGTSDARICYFAYPGDERPVFDFTDVRPAGLRVSAFFIAGDWLHLRGFDIVGVQVTVKGHTQSECISARGGSHCIFEHLAMHHGMAIGYYQTAGSYNLVLNCDAYCNYDPYSEGPYGGNVDGFGGHVLDARSTGNVFRGCRAWWNSDDGFDLINCQSAFVIDHCWSFLNGYQPESMERAGDGTGFKAGGYGMNEKVRKPKVTPRHTISHCIAYLNKNKGFYANHHLGGLTWINNTGYRNPSNFCMLNRLSADVRRDTLGYDHILVDNLSLEPLSAGRHVIDIDTARCVLGGNSFGPAPDPEHPILRDPRPDDFLSLDPEQLKAPRQPDGSLPDIDFLRLRPESPFFAGRCGWQFDN